jgi:hypothetical protein
VRVPESRDVSYPKRRSLNFIHNYRARLVIGVMTKTAPCPLLRFRNKSSFYRIAMYVTQLLEPFLLGENDEVIKSRLPDAVGFWQDLFE